MIRWMVLLLLLLFKLDGIFYLLGTIHDFLVIVKRPLIDIVKM